MTRACDEDSPQQLITLVTAWFDIGRKQTKYRENPYPGWIRHFLSCARWPLVIFCDEQSLDMLKEARGDKPAVWHVTSLEDFHVYKYWDELKSLETGHGLAAEYGLIWHEKCNFLRRTLSENPFGSKMVFWCDIGLFRYGRNLSPVSRMQFHLYPDIEWPNSGVCLALPQDKVILLPYRSSGGFIILGGFFGGAVHPVRRWCDAYYERLDERVRKGTLIHSDECVMQSLYRRRPELAHALPPGLAPWPAVVSSLILLIKKNHASYFKWYFLGGKRLLWKYFCRRIFSGPVR